MIKLAKVVLKGFKSFKSSTEVTLSHGVNIFCGANGSGLIVFLILTDQGSPVCWKVFSLYWVQPPEHYVHTVVSAFQAYTQMFGT